MDLLTDLLIDKQPDYTAASILTEFFDDDELFWPTNHKLKAQLFRYGDIKRVGDAVEPIAGTNEYILQQLWENIPTLLHPSYTPTKELARNARNFVIQEVMASSDDSETSSL